MGKIIPAYIRFPNFKYKALTLSYDDGVRQDERFIDYLGLKRKIPAGKTVKVEDGKIL